LVPKKVNDYQEVRYTEVSAEMLEWRESEPDFINKVMKVGFSYQTKGQRWKKAHMNKYKIKTIVMGHAVSPAVSHQLQTVVARV
jgi:hypothetical protein